MKTATMVLFSVALSVAPALRGDNVDYSTWIYQTKSDTTANPSSTSGYSINGGTFWSSGVAPSAGNNYYVPPGITNYTQNKSSSVAFKGDCLAVAGTVRFLTGSSKTMSYPELRLLGGGLLAWNSIGTLGGKVSVDAPADNPAVLRYVYAVTSTKNYTAFLAADLESPAGSFIRIERDPASVPYQSNFKWGFTGDKSSFLGTMILADADSNFTASNFSDFAGTLAYACAAKLSPPAGFPGTISSADGYVLDATSLNGEKFAVTGGNSLKFTADRTMADLSLASNSTLRLAFSSGAAAVPTVTNRFAVEAGATVVLDGIALKDLTNLTAGVEIAHLSGAALEAVPDVSGLLFPPVVASLPHAAFAWEDGVSGGKTLRLSWKPVVILDVKPSDGQNFFTDETYKTFWSDGELPRAGRDYLIYGLDSFYWSNPSSLSFAGDSLTIKGQTINLKAENAAIGDFTLDNVSFSVYSSSKTWTGNLRILSGNALFRFYQDDRLTIKSTVSGDGRMCFRSWDGNQSKPYGSVELTGTNTAYHGRIWLNTLFLPASGSRPATPDTENNILMTMYISDGRNLGGPFTADADTWKAVTIDNYSRVYFRRSLTLDEPTRGIFINRGAIFQVPSGAVATILSPVTWNGELVKRGAGTLALGGTALFTDGNPGSAPAATSNTLTVAAGTLKPLAPEATDGLAISFAEGAGLLLPASGEKGLYSVRAGSSVAADGAISVAFDFDGLEETPRNFALPVATFADAAAAEAFIALLSPSARPQGYGFAGYTHAADGNGAETVYANFKANGRFIITVR